jgi:hypothetical protein
MGPRALPASDLAAGYIPLPLGDSTPRSKKQPGTQQSATDASSPRPQSAAKPAVANVPPPNPALAQASASLQTLLRQSLAASSTTPFAPIEAVEGASQERSAQKAAGRRAAAAAQTDGHGIPRRFERDLGGMQPQRIVKPAAGTAGAAGAQEAEPDVPADAAYTGRSLIRPTTPIRDVQTLFALKWVEMSRAEGALLRNMGWTQPTWDTRNEPTGRWPQSMRTKFTKQGMTQRESIRKMGFSDESWDDYVSQFD